ncbi:MAG: hypothetical protein JXJ04_17100 [Spirochaetales bacterium]|nr:hypothetical protein [Spirochaetales bacterium]
MQEIKESLIKRAKNTHKTIYPCKGKTELEECFTIEGRKIIFWFNTEDRNTHTISAPITRYFKLNDAIRIEQQ